MAAYIARDIASGEIVAFGHTDRPATLCAQVQGADATAEFIAVDPSTLPVDLNIGELPEAVVIQDEFFRYTYDKTKSGSKAFVKVVKAGVSTTVSRGG